MIRRLAAWLDRLAERLDVRLDLDWGDGEEEDEEVRA